MSWLSNLFKPKEVTQTPDKEAWQLASGKANADWAQKYLSQYAPNAEYGGQFTAGMAPGEVAGQEWLAKYLNQPATGENYNLASGEIKRTLNGAYDPYTSPFYQATRTGALREQQDAIDAAHRGQGARGTYFQSTGITEDRKLRENTTNYLDQILGKMALQERQNRLAAVDPAMKLEQYAQNATLQKAQAGMTLGSLPRLIEQNDLESRYKDFLRKQDALAGAAGVNQGVFGTNINYGVKDYQAPSAFERIMGPVLGIGTQLALNYATGGMSGMGGGGTNAVPFSSSAYSDFASGSKWGL